jgi:hypothetical protein
MQSREIQSEIVQERTVLPVRIPIIFKIDARLLIP